MYTRLFLILVFIAAAVRENVASAGNIVHGISVVVIDAGHGGKFPGAHYNGVYEKDLTLNIALRLGTLIEQEMPGVKVVYTRKTDKALSEDLARDLQMRADIANKADGDVFISIHVNAARASAAKGVETLIMGESSKEQRYNESALFDSNREDIIDMSDERTAAIVRAYIQNLQFTYGEYSMAMANCIQNNYRKDGRALRGVKPQLLRVLYATDMPGVLTEIGFMSNPDEMAYMTSEKGQREIAQSLLRAVKDYSACVLGARGEQEQTSGPDSASMLAASASASPAATPETPAAEPLPVKPSPGDAAPVSVTPKAPKPEPKPEAKPAPAPKPAPVPEARPTTEPIRYTVQLLSAARPLTPASAEFKAYRNQAKQYTSEGRYRYKYCVGEYDDTAAAQAKLREVRKIFPGAFVVRYRGTQIVK